MAHRKTVLVSDIPSDITREQLTIHFQRSHNGGGDVSNVVYPLSPSRPHEAMITFDLEEICHRVQHQTQIIDDKLVKVRPLPHQVFSRVEAVIDHDALMAIPQHQLRQTLDKIEDETGVVCQLLSQSGKTGYSYSCSGNWIQVKTAEKVLQKYCLEPRDRHGAGQSARNGDLGDRIVRSDMNGSVSRSELDDAHSRQNGPESLQNGVDSDVAFHGLPRGRSRRGRQGQDVVSDVHAYPFTDRLSADKGYSSLPDARSMDGRSSRHVYADSDTGRAASESRHTRLTDGRSAEKRSAEKAPSRSRRKDYDREKAGEIPGYGDGMNEVVEDQRDKASDRPAPRRGRREREENDDKLANHLPEYANELLRSRQGRAPSTPDQAKAETSRKSEEARNDVESSPEQHGAQTNGDSLVDDDYTGDLSKGASVETSPVAVDIDLYMFMKHTQSRRLDSIETDCDVKFQCDESADTGIVTIVPNSRKTIPEQVQLARDQLISIYENLYQTIDKSDLHIPKGLDETKGEMAAEDTKSNFSNVYIKKEGPEHYALYGDKDSVQSAKMHFLTSLCKVLEIPSIRREREREIDSGQPHRPQPSYELEPSATSEPAPLETGGGKEEEVVENGEEIMRREPAGESEPEETATKSRRKHSITVLSNNSRELTFLTESNVKTKVYSADITKLPVDAITNAAHEQLINTGGVAYAIRKAAGPYYHRQCEEYIDNHGPLYVTEVIHTNAGILPCKYVLHAVGPRWEDFKNKNECIETLTATVVNCFSHANDLLLCQSLALPLISSGIFGVPLEMVAQAMFDAVMEFSKKRPKTDNIHLTEIHIVDYEMRTVSHMQKVFRENLRRAGHTDIADPPSPADIHAVEARVDLPVETDEVKHDSGEKRRERPTTPSSFQTGERRKADPSSVDVGSQRRLFSSERLAGSQRDQHRSIFSSERLSRPVDRDAHRETGQRSSAFQQYKVTPSLDKYVPSRSSASPRTGITGEKIQPSLRPKTADRHSRGRHSESSALKPMRATVDALGPESSFDDDQPQGAVGGETVTRVMSAKDKEALVQEILDEHEKGPHTRESTRETQEKIDNLFVEDEFSPIRSSGARARTRSLERSRPKTADAAPRGRSASLDRKKTVTGTLERGSTVRRCQLCRTSKSLSMMRDCSHFICSTCKKYSRDCYDCLQLSSSKRDTSQLKVQATSLQPSGTRTSASQPTSYKERPRSATPNFTSSGQRPSSPSVSSSRQRPSTPNFRPSSQRVAHSSTDFRVSGQSPRSMPHQRSLTPTPSSGQRPSTPTLSSSSRQRSATPTLSTPRKECPICMDRISSPKTLRQCQHTFCKDCIERAMDVKPVCPVCGVIYGTLRGDQPDGTMDISVDKSKQLPGYPGCGTLSITYTFPDGIQTDRHPHPGRPHTGTRRRAYLPDNTQGREVLQLLKKAFQAKLLFTIGQSVTTGLDDVIVWNDIHQKTSRHGGPANHGYPDPFYLRRVKEELAAKGIK